MAFWHTLAPQEELSDTDIQVAKHWLVRDAIAGHGMVVLTLGPFVIAFLVLLGASNAVIGLLGAIGPLAQILQLPAVVLIERVKWRKAITVTTAVISRLMWLIAAAVPFFVPEPWRITVFLVSFTLFHALNAAVACGFNSWVRDVIPEDAFGEVFARRMLMATGVGVAVSLVGAGFVEVSRQLFDLEIHAYSGLYLLGALSGLIGSYFLSRVPEPRMHPPVEPALFKRLTEPLRNANFRRFLFFIGVWSFGVNFSGPFFAVYMLKRLGLSIGWLVGLTVLSQVINVMFFRLWGGLADRFSSKSVLTISLPMFILTFLMWPLTTNPTPHMFTIPLLLAIHVIGGVATAGVTLAANNLTFKSAPRGKAAAYMATSACVTGIMGSAAPLLAGFAADSLELYEIALTLTWARLGVSPDQISFPPLTLKGLDFIFLFSALVLLYSLHRLLAIKEEGEADPALVRREFRNELERRVRQISTVAGLRVFSDFSFGRLIERGQSLLTRPAEPPDDRPETD
jgi:MFS family permease